jgi:hypothetical protein
MDEQHPAVVHLQATLVGASDSGVVWAFKASTILIFERMVFVESEAGD